MSKSTKKISKPLSFREYFEKAKSLVQNDNLEGFENYYRNLEHQNLRKNGINGLNQMFHLFRLVT